MSRAQPRLQVPDDVVSNWDGFLRGELGVLAVDEDGQHVVCHMCGRSFRFLGMHVWQSHGVTSRRYRALFGLNARTPLASPAFVSAKRLLAERTLGPYWEHSRELLALSSEQRRAYGRQRVLRLEARRDPANQARWRDSMRRAREIKDALSERDPSYRAQLSARISVGRGGRVPQACAICGVRVDVMPHIVRLGRRVTCGPACLHELRCRTSAEVHRRREVQARVRLAGRQGWPSPAQVLAAPAELDRLTRADRELVWRFYGLPETVGAPMQVPASLGELATAAGLSRHRVRAHLFRIVQTVVAHTETMPAGERLCDLRQEHRV